MDLNGTVALVTGGNGGLGQRICHALAREGVHIAVMYARSRDQAEEVAGDLTSRYQINAAAFACDITDASAVEDELKKVMQQNGKGLEEFNAALSENGMTFDYFKKRLETQMLISRYLEEKILSGASSDVEKQTLFASWLDGERRRAKIQVFVQSQD